MAGAGGDVAVARCSIQAILLISMGLAPPAAAQTYPEKTVRIIVPTAAGGSIDTTARVVAEKLAAAWGKPAIIENQPGASMIIGAEAAAKSAPDGYTLLVAHDGTTAMNQAVYPNLPYNVLKDFTPIAMMTAIPLVILVNAGVEAKTLQELIALARAHPGKLNHATGGTATLLALELLKAMAKIDIASIPYRGAAPAMTGVMAGDTQMIIADLASAAAGRQSGRLRTLAVTTLQRAKGLPDVPTADEAGVPGYETSTWIGTFAPANTPKPSTDTIEAGIKAALAQPDVRDRLEKLGMEIRSGSAEELRQKLTADLQKWSRLVKEKNIRIGP
jgi:tripartite-type tricarboxylate transporter receptor subunit TctC